MINPKEITLDIVRTMFDHHISLKDIIECAVKYKYLQYEDIVKVLEVINGRR